MKPYTTLFFVCIVAFFMLCRIGTVAALELTAYADTTQFPLMFSLGAGAEANANTRTDISFGGKAQIDFRVARPFSLGIKGVYSMSQTEVKVLEAGALLRWNVFAHEWGSGGVTDLFLQAEGGIALGWEQNPAATDKHGEGEPATDPSGGIAAGIRITFPFSLYLEPYGRFGYPYTWAGGIALGYTFRKKPQPIQKSTPPLPPYEFYNILAWNGETFAYVGKHIGFCVNTGDFRDLNAAIMAENNRILDITAKVLYMNPVYAANRGMQQKPPPTGLMAARTNTIIKMLDERGTAPGIEIMLLRE
jgi:hypothetical protein